MRTWTIVVAVVGLGLGLVGCGGGDDDDAGGGETTRFRADAEELVAACRGDSEEVEQCSLDEVDGFEELCASVAPDDGDVTEGLIQARPGGASVEAVVTCTFGEARAGVTVNFEGPDFPALCDRDEPGPCEEIGGLEVRVFQGQGPLLTSSGGLGLAVARADGDVASYAVDVYSTVYGVSLGVDELAALASEA